MQRETIAIVGFGDLGQRLVALLPAQRWRCYGLRRSADAVPIGVEGIAVDLRDAATLSVLERLQPDALMIALSPAQRSAAGYRQGFAQAMTAIVAGLGAHRPQRAFFVSSSRVYSEADGGWVDESSPLAVNDSHAAAILDAERQFLDAIDTGVVLRAAGLYGNTPGHLLKRVATGTLTASGPLRYGNRIHRDDVARFIAFALDNPPDSRIINLVDNAPVAMQEVESWLCEQLGRPYEPPGPESAATPRGHKRLHNKRLRASGFSLRYPDFRVGYATALHRWLAHSEREDGLDLD